MKTFRLRLQLLWSVLRLPRWALAELDEDLIDLRNFYSRPVTETVSPPVVKVRGRYGNTLVRPEFPIVAD